jgi:hypothetical protein
MFTHADIIGMVAFRIIHYGTEIETSPRFSGLNFEHMTSKHVHN